MKNLKFLILLVFTFHSVHSQVPDSLIVQSNPNLYNFYTTNQKNQLKTGWFPPSSAVVANSRDIVSVVYSSFFNSDYLPGSIYDSNGYLPSNFNFPVYFISGTDNIRAEVFIGAGDISIKKIPFNNRYRSVGMKYSF